jgi:hypothetical protein
MAQDAYTPTPPHTMNPPKKFLESQRKIKRKVNTWACGRMDGNAYPYEYAIAKWPKPPTSPQFLEASL